MKSLRTLALALLACASLSAADRPNIVLMFLDDPLEQDNVIADHPEIANQLRQTASDYLKQFPPPALLLPVLAESTAARPNFLFILTDDQGYGDVSAYGPSDVRTPNIDRIGSEGVLFTTMRANCTVCSPSRAALLTGRYADRVGVPGVIRTRAEDSWGYFDPKVPTLADQLRGAGYHTAIIGKWHLGLESPNTPNERGFDLFHGFLGDMMDSYTTHLRLGNNYMRRNSEVIKPQGHATDLFSDWAADYLRGRAGSKDQPFFLYLAYNAPHFPIEPPDEWLAKVKQRAPQMEENRAKNVAFVEHLDAGIGRVLATLEETGLAGNTVVIFAADLDAMSLVPLLQGGTIRTPRDLYFVCREGGSKYGGKSYEAIIRGDRKLIQNDPFSPLELYDLREDPQESRNLAKTNHKKFEELTTGMRRHVQRGGTTPWQPPNH